MRDAVLLVHVIDGSSDRCEKQLAVVEDLLGSLELGEIPTLRVFNKADKASPELLSNLCRRYQGIPVSALDRSTLPSFLDRLGGLLVTGKNISSVKKATREACDEPTSSR